MLRRIEFSVGTERLVGNLHSPDDAEKPSPCVVLSHGFMSHRGSEKYLQMGYRFPLEGIAVFRFDHRGAINGESDGKFEDTTLTGRVEDLSAALGCLDQVPEIDRTRTGLFGSSLGGTTILTLPHNERIRAVVLLATPISLPGLRTEMKAKLEPQGYFQYPGGTRISKGFFDDMAKYNLVEKVKTINCPLLIIHGDLDEQVPRHQAFVLYRHAHQPKEIRLIEGADHAITDPAKLNDVLAITLDWFKRYL